VRVSTGMSGLKIGPSGGLLSTQCLNFGFNKKQEIPWQVE